MYAGEYVFAQVMDFLPLHVFRRCVARYDGEHRVKRFSCLDQYLCLAFAQLTWRESLRDMTRAHEGRADMSAVGQQRDPLAPPAGRPPFFRFAANAGARVAGTAAAAPAALVRSGGAGRAQRGSAR
jgi:hypothetical protein